MAMAVMGFSINVLTLLGLVLAIGLVVDDAIVVLENVHRRIELGEDPLLASLLGSREIAFAVIATTLVLISVFVPLSFMGGNTGRLFTEFGLALAASVLFSGVIALTLTPMMCSKLLRAHEGESLLVRLTEPFFLALNEGLRWTLDRALRAPLLVMGASAAMSLFAVVLFNALPKEFAPTEDRGVVIIPTTGPEGASFTPLNMSCAWKACCNAIWTMAKLTRFSRLLVVSNALPSAISPMSLCAWPRGVSVSASNRPLPQKYSRWCQVFQVFVALP
jgi:multidrug efflux pump